MDLLTIVKKLEEKNMEKEVQGVHGLAGFGCTEATMWFNTGSLKVKVNNGSALDFWKVFCVEDLEGNWHLVVVQLVDGCVVAKVFAVVSISSLVIS